MGECGGTGIEYATHEGLGEVSYFERTITATLAAPPAPSNPVTVPTGATGAAGAAAPQAVTAQPTFNG